MNALYLEDSDYQEEYPDLSTLLQGYKQQFMKYDMDHSGDINEFELKLMMEKLDQVKTFGSLGKAESFVFHTLVPVCFYNQSLNFLLNDRNKNPNSK